MPTGHVFLIFELDGIERHTCDNKPLEPSGTFRKAWVSGLHRNHLSISAHDDSEMFVIQFKAFGAYPFLQLPMQKIADRVVPGEQFSNKDLLTTRERLYAAATSKDKFAVADEWLHAHFDCGHLPPQYRCTSDSLLIVFGVAQKSGPIINVTEHSQGS